MMKIEELKKEKCCGCTACVQVCPKNAIEFVYDERGFGYPSINKKLCVNCGLCEKVCQFKKKKDMDFKQEYYAAKCTDDKIRLKSRSGGIFFLLAKKVIQKSGVVYGVVLDSDMNVRFDRATSLEECQRMQGSKYVESSISGIYTKVKQDLQNDRYVLFSGTACQVAGLYGYLGLAKFDKLFTIDIVCHGVSSAKVYKDFIGFAEKKYKGKIEQFNFRDKSFGWDSTVESYIINGKKHYSRNYSRLFYSIAAMRPSCAECPFASYNRPADMTVADFWGLRKIAPDFDDDRGVSAIMVNSEKGKAMLQMILGDLQYFEVSKDDCAQPNLLRPTPKSEKTEAFWNLYERKGIKSILNKYGAYDLLRRIKWKVIDLPQLLKNTK